MGRRAKKTELGIDFIQMFLSLVLVDWWRNLNKSMVSIVFLEPYGCISISRSVFKDQPNRFKNDVQVERQRPVA